MAEDASVMSSVFLDVLVRPFSWSADAPRPFVSQLLDIGNLYCCYGCKSTINDVLVKKCDAINSAAITTCLVRW